jgi:hypothetical protein
MTRLLGDLVESAIEEQSPYVDGNCNAVCQLLRHGDA